MSLIDKSVDFNSTITGLTNAVYSVVKQIFTNSSLDTFNNFIYFDTDKKNGISFNNTTGTDYITIIYLINNNSHTYNYRYVIDGIAGYSKLYYNISKNKDMIAFGLGHGVLDFGIGYDEKIGFWEFFIGALSKSNISSTAYLFIKNSTIYKTQHYTQSYANTRWLASTATIVNSLIQIPLIVTAGNFSSLFEIFSCNKLEEFSLLETIYSSNKYYRLLHGYDLVSLNSNEGHYNSVVLAMEVADD